MARKVTFRVTNRLTENTGQVVLVFLIPSVDLTSETIFLSAWQVLNPAANGGNQSFDFDPDDIQLAVENENTLCRSPLVEIKGNQLYTVSNAFNQGPVLHLSHNETPPNPRQVAVRNTTDPPITLRAIVAVDQREVIVKDGINLGSTLAVEGTSTLFFAVVSAVGPNSQLQQFSRLFAFVPPSPNVFSDSVHSSYNTPGGVRRVEVTWQRPGGMSGSDTLTFNPPSAPPPTFD